MLHEQMTVNFNKWAKWAGKVARGVSMSISVLLGAGNISFQSDIAHTGTRKDLSIDKIKEQNLMVVKKAVEGIRETLPQKIDRYTTMVAVSGRGNRLIYTFEVNGGPKSDSVLREEGKKRMAPVVRSGICRSARRFLESDINISYIYLSKTTKAEILHVDMNRKKCDHLRNQIPE